MLETPKALSTDEVTLNGILASKQVMDNQQASLDLGWLAGFIDGEGCFLIARQKSNNDRGIKLRPHFTISNTSQANLERAANVLSSFGVPCHIYNLKDRNRNGTSFKPQGSIQIVGFRRVKRLLDLMIPHIAGKSEEAKLLLEWVDYRLALSEKNPLHRKLTTVDWQYKERLSELKKNPTRPRDYTPNTNLGEDIVRPAMRVAEESSRIPA